MSQSPSKPTLRRKVRRTKKDSAAAANKKGDSKSTFEQLVGSVGGSSWHENARDISGGIALVLGGCCANVLTFERLLAESVQVGSAMTLSQMVFIACSAAPPFLTWNKSNPFPQLKPRQVPLFQWGLQVFVLTFGTLLNNWAFAFGVPITLQIVFRSSVLAVSMLFGRFFMKKRYSSSQVISVLLATVGVILATLSRPQSSSSSATGSQFDLSYITGVLMLTGSLFLTGVLGMLQEQTYKKYGPCWKEGLFYTHVLSLPLFLPFTSDVKHGFKMLSKSSARLYGMPVTYIFLSLNLITQSVCAAGVNQLTSRVSSVSTNLVLTTRKAISLCLSVWFFGNDWTVGLILGAGMVFAGSFMYSLSSTRA